MEGLMNDFVEGLQGSGSWYDDAVRFYKKITRSTAEHFLPSIRLNRKTDRHGVGFRWGASPHGVGLFYWRRNLSRIVQRFKGFVLRELPVDGGEIGFIPALEFQPGESAVGQSGVHDGIAVRADEFKRLSGGKVHFCFHGLAALVHEVCLERPGGLQRVDIFGNRKKSVLRQHRLAVRSDRCIKGGGERRQQVAA